MNLTKKNFIPMIIAAFFSALLVGLLALPHSQYALLGEMSDLSNGTSTPNWGVTVPAIFTVFVIILLVFSFLLASVSFLAMRLYNFHTLGVIELFFIGFETVLEGGYFFSGLGHEIEKGVSVIQWPNILVFALNLLFFASYLVTYILFIQKPFKALNQSLDVQLKEEEKEEKATQTSQPEEKKDLTKEEMNKYILKLQEEGKLTPEEALDMLKKFNS